MSEPTRSDPVRTFFGVALVSVGVLIACLCGLCTCVFLVGGLMPHGDVSFSGMALVIGGIPTAIGVGLFFAGRSLLRSARAALPEETPRPPPSGPPPG